MEIRSFTTEAHNEAVTYSNDNKLLESREIVRGITIDGETSMDLDDGFDLFEKDGNYLLQVSIADVTEAVKYNSQLFEIAYDRLETRYLRDRNIPMIPRVLSENKMSLMPLNHRPAITFNIEINQNLDVVDFGMKETVFYNEKKYSYSEFDNIPKKNDENSPIFQKFSRMSELAKKLLEKRRQKGALAIYDIKKGICTDEEGNIIKIDAKRSHASYLIVQEFMILTNKMTAWYFAKNDLPFLNRNHTIKQTAPNRSEILEQINTIMMNPEHLESLRTRCTVWFNRATYSPVVRGHFGLNEPVYCHVTSPIRRIADLINHYLIKAHVRNETAPISMDELQEMSETINKGIAEIKDETSEKFKEFAISKGESKIAYFSEKQFQNLTKSELTELIYAAAKSDIMNDRLKNAIEKKFKSNEIDMKMMNIMLFKSPKNSEKWKDTIDSCLKYIKVNSGYAMSLLNIMVQQGLLEDIVTDLQESEYGYKAKMTAKYTGNLITPQTYSFSSKKKEAISLTAYNILRIMLNLQEENQKMSEDNNNLNNWTVSTAIDADSVNSQDDNTSTQQNNENSDNLQRELINSGIATATDDTGLIQADIKEDYISKLYQICQSNKSFQLSDFNIKLSGLSHKPTITCTAELKTPEDTITETAVAMNKRFAKQEVARKILLKIEQIIIVEPEKPKAEIVIDLDNPVGSLQEYCVKYKLAIPDYKFNNVGSMRNPLFECELNIVIEGNPYTFKNRAENKKSAKMNVAKEAMELIRKF